MRSRQNETSKQAIKTDFVPALLPYAAQSLLVVWRGAGRRCERRLRGFSAGLPVSRATPSGQSLTVRRRPVGGAACATFFVRLTTTPAVHAWVGTGVGRLPVTGGMEVREQENGIGRGTGGREGGAFGGCNDVKMGEDCVCIWHHSLGSLGHCRVITLHQHLQPRTDRLALAPSVITED